MKKFLSIFLALISGCLIMFARPGFNVHWIIWFALVPLFIALHKKKKISSFFIGQVAAFPPIISVVYCIPSICSRLGTSQITGIFAVVFMSVYYSFYVGIFSVFYSFVTNKIENSNKKRFWIWFIVIPGAWTLLEILHTKIIPGVPFTFISLGYSQWVVPEIIQFGSIFGVFGVSFLIVLFNLAIYNFFWKKKKLVPIIIGLIIISVYIFGAVRIKNFDAKKKENKIKVAVLDAQIDALKKWDKKYSKQLAEKYFSLLKDVVKQKPNLIVWTESAIPWAISEDDDLLEATLNITYPIRANHLVGIPILVPGKKDVYYNSAFFIEPDGKIISQYNKEKLLLLAEKSIKLFEEKNKKSVFNFAPKFVSGQNIKIPNTPLGKIGIAICNEIAYPALIRKKVETGADFLVNMNNDIWFPGDMIPTWHYALAVFRAVENNREVVVASNGGISGFIDSCGRTKTKSFVNTPSTIIGFVNSETKLTIYTRNCIMLTISLIFIVVFLILILIKNN